MELIRFFMDNFPSISTIIWLFPVSIIWSFFALFIAGFCKSKWDWKTGYTRKLFHFFIFISAYFYQKYIGLSGVFVLGWAVTVVLVYACFKGSDNRLYEALAREKDAPHRTKYIVYSYLATFVGGVLSNVLFGKFAVVGYAIAGIADAVAEPIGTRYGKHFYSVFSFDKQKIAIRSWEGSVGVLVASFFVFIGTLSGFDLSCNVWMISIVFALLCAVTEALSPSGFDNLLLQLVGSFLAYASVIYF